MKTVSIILLYRHSRENHIIKRFSREGGLSNDTIIVYLLFRYSENTQWLKTTSHELYLKYLQNSYSTLYNTYTRLLHNNTEKIISIFHLKK